VVKLLKYVIILILASAITFSIVEGAIRRAEINLNIEIENFPYINQRLLESSRYTQKDEDNPAVINEYTNNFRLSYTDEQLETLGFELMFETDQLEVYFELDSFSMIVKNLETGYMWSSRPEFQGVSGSREDNTATRNLMNSGLWVEYVNQNNVQSSTIVTASLYTLAANRGVEYENDGSVTEENNDPIRPYMIVDGTYSKMRVENKILSKTQNKFVVDVNLKTINTRFNVEISLVNQAIHVLIPSESIIENDDNLRLISLQVFPYFGATREDKFPGYIVIPDGIGALVRTNQRHNTSFQARFYGSDRGYGGQTIPMLSIPIYGFIHQADHNGYFVEILEGAETSQLRATFWGSGTRFHRVHSRFMVRSVYRSVINKAGDGREVIDSIKTSSNYHLAYHILSNDEANYSGMASIYRTQLKERGVLSSREKVVDGNIPLHTSYIMSDQEPSFLGTSRVTMTTPNDVLDMYEFLKNNGIFNQQIELYGWSVDGFVYRAPYRTRAFLSRDFKAMTQKITSEDNTVYLSNEYTVSSELSRRINYNRDIARSVNRLKMVTTRSQLNGRLIDMYFLSPDRSLGFARSDLNNINALHVSGLSMQALGNTLFTYYNGRVIERNETIPVYQEIASLYDSLLLSMPNDYMFEYIDGYLNLPITNTQYDFYTDLIPLIPMILKGSISYYTPFLNFNALAEDRFLAMVDFGANPSYVITEKPTYAMRYTLANSFFTTSRSDYENDILSTYEYINEALKHVTNAYMVERKVIETGLVLVTYSNGVSIYVNYNYQSRLHQGNVILPRDYKVVTS
jgi:predicted transcriptional regulator with HTH domain